MEPHQKKRKFNSIKSNRRLKSTNESKSNVLDKLVKFFEEYEQMIQRRIELEKEAEFLRNKLKLMENNNDNKFDIINKWCQQNKIFEDSETDCEEEVKKVNKIQLQQQDNVNTFTYNHNMT